MIFRAPAKARYAIQLNVKRKCPRGDRFTRRVEDCSQSLRYIRSIAEEMQRNVHVGEGTQSAVHSMLTADFVSKLNHPARCVRIRKQSEEEAELAIVGTAFFE